MKITQVEKRQMRLSSWSLMIFLWKF